MLYFVLMMGIGLVLIEGVLLLFWGYYLLRRNVSVVDIAWGIGFIAAAVAYSLLGQGFFWRKGLVLTIVMIWAFRLVRHISNRFMPNREDPRYLLLLSSWPFASHPLFQALTLFVFQGILISILSLPFALMSQNGLPFFTPCEVFGLLIWMGGMAGESSADRQLNQFKQNPAISNLVCETGLWKYSRHPNYFFEWVIWLGYGTMALSSPYGWLGMFSPLLMLYLLVQVSGIPLAEAQALKTRGEAYRDYQARTSTFFPWFPRRKTKHSK